MMKHRHCGSGILVLCGVFIGVFLTTVAEAELITFEPKTGSLSAHNDVADQLTMELIDSGGGAVTFRFKNTGSLNSTIAQIGFFALSSSTDLFADLNTAGTITYNPVTNDPNFDEIVNFDTKFPNSPEGYSTPSGYDFLFAADALPPPAKNGIDPGEQLDVIVKLANLVSFGAVKSAMTSSSDTSAFFVGLHVTGIDANPSSWYYTSTPIEPTPSEGVPVPPTVILFGMGMLGLCGYKWRKGSTESEAS